MLRLAIICATIILMSSASLAGELAVGSRLILKENFKITQTESSDYILLNDVEVFLFPCKVYVLNGMGPGMNNPVIHDDKDNIKVSMYRAAFPETHPNLIKRYLEVGWKLEKTVISSKYSSFPKFYTGKVFVIESIDGKTIHVIDRIHFKYKMILPKNIDKTFEVD